MRSVRHWTPGYVASRVRQMAHQWRHPDEPWWRAEAVRLLDGLLLDSDRGFEWGSGRSTQWLASRLRELTSVESDPVWYAKVRADLERLGCSNVKLELHEVDAAEDPSRHPFVRAIDAVADGSLDFALVDGWARDHCALAALPKLSAGALLVIDDAHRYLPVPDGVRAPGARTQATGPLTPAWQELLERVSGWRRIWTRDGISPSLILFREP